MMRASLPPSTSAEEDMYGLLRLGGVAHPEKLLAMEEVMPKLKPVTPIRDQSPGNPGMG